MTILQQNAPKTYGNAWLNPLHNRALSDATLARAGIRPDGRGWSYPIGPDSKARRWKAYPNQDGPKYLWKPEQPESARFYDPAGDLDQHVVAAGGVLLLAAGEPDTWSLWEAGLFHASCTLAGEGVIPPWFVGELHRLNVRTVRIWPDRDPAGLRHAVKLAVALAGSGIALEAYELPFDQASKGDINTLLIDVGAAGLPGALNACPAIDLVTLAAAADHQAEQLPQQRHSAPPADFASLFDQYRADLDQAVPSGWKKGKRNAKGFYQNIPCPFHEERNPSAGYNPDSSTVFCFVCGDHDYREIAAHVGFQAWDAYKADQLPRYSLADLRPVRKAEIRFRLSNAIGHGARLALDRCRAIAAARSPPQIPHRSRPGPGCDVDRLSHRGWCEARRSADCGRYAGLLRAARGDAGHRASSSKIGGWFVGFRGFW